jgi:hypothetical protein
MRSFENSDKPAIIKIIRKMLKEFLKLYGGDDNLEIISDRKSRALTKSGF